MANWQILSIQRRSSFQCRYLQQAILAFEWSIFEKEKYVWRNGLYESDEVGVVQG